MKGKGKIILSIFSLILAIVALATSSFAWIVSVKRSGNIVFITGRVKYVLTGELQQLNTIVPNKELVNSHNKYTITNDSSIDSELRMRVLFQFSNEDVANGANWTVFTEDNIEGNANNSSQLVLGILSSAPTCKWNYNTNDMLWYFNNGTDGTITASNKIGIPVLESLYANGDACGNNECSKRNLFIKLEFQAKQKNYVTWDELGQIVVKA